MLTWSTKGAVSMLLAAVVAADFRVKFDVETTKGPGSFVVLVHEDWAPIGAARFKELVEAKFYDDSRFFRVLPDFMVQFGLNGDPTESNRWRAQSINDEADETPTKT